MAASLQKKLLKWFDAEKRDLPWRQTRDPYAIWVSEIMLQQTQVSTVVDYYERWMRRFPSVEALAKADEQEVLAAWQGLGYYRRCKMLHAGARHVLQTGMPGTLEDWLSVPGIGRYTAGAISSIAQELRSPVVDGNVERVFARLTGCDFSGRRLHSAAWQWAEQSLDRTRPGDWNQALMELGACVCKPLNPQCSLCPVRSECVARRSGTQESLPTKEAQRPIIHIKEIVFVPFHDSAFGFIQASDGEWWHGMWLFPRSSRLKELSELVGKGQLEHAGRFKYTVTHHRIQMDAFLHRSEHRSESLTWVPCDELDRLPIPAPQRKALKLAVLRLNSPALLPEEAASSKL